MERGEALERDRSIAAMKYCLVCRDCGEVEFTEVDVGMPVLRERRWAQARAVMDARGWDGDLCPSCVARASGAMP